MHRTKMIPRLTGMKAFSLLLKNWTYIVLSLCALSLLNYHFRLIANPFQNEYREGAIVLITNILTRGGNPYALENQPEYANMYGIFYHLVVYPFALLFGSTLIVHRIVAAFCIWGACYLFFRATHRMNISLFLGLSFTLILYRYFLIGTPIARPDSLGILLFLGSIFIPWKSNYSSSSLVLSVLLGVLAFSTKPYFILSLPFLAVYLFLFKSKRKGVLYGAAFMAATSTVILITSYLFETYLTNIFFASVNFGVKNEEYAARQLVLLIQENLFLLFIPFIYVNFLVWTVLTQSFNLNLNESFKFAASKTSLRKFNEPLILADPGLITSGLFFFALVFYVKLGQHPGSFMIYAYQLILPFLYLCILRIIQIQKSQQITAVFSSLVLLQLLWLARPGFLKFPISPVQWNNLQVLLSKHQNIYNSPAIVSLLVSQDKKVYDSGLSDVYSGGLVRQSLWKAIAPIPQKDQDGYAQFLQEIEESIISKKYDLMVLTKGPFFPTYFVSRDLVKKYYQYQETLPAPMGYVDQYWELEIWKPK